MSVFDNPAERQAYLAMTSLVNKMLPINYATGHAPLRRTDPVAYADAVTSMCDWRAALSLAIGTPVDQIDRNGYRQVQR